MVTGASRGIGRAIAQRFSSAGAAVVAASRSRPPRELDAAWLRADLADQSQAARLVDEAVERTGRLDVLVNNAATEHVASVERIAPRGWEHVLAVNLTAPFLTAKHAFPHLREAGGAIVSVSSIAGLTADPGNVAYNVSKAGLLNLTRATAADGGLTTVTR